MIDDIKIVLAPIVTFSKAVYTASENSIEVPIIKVNGTVPVGGIDIKLGVTALSAKEGIDYAIEKTIHVDAGIYNLGVDFPIKLTILDDAIKEYNEDIQFTIASASNGVIINAGCGGSMNATYTIVDNDVFDAGSDITVCPSESITLNATGSLNPRWNKNVKQGVPFTAPAASGEYVYTAYDTTFTDFTNNLVVNGDFSTGNSGFSIDPRYTYNPAYDPTFSSFHLSTNQYSILPNPKGTNPNFYNMTDHSGTNPSRMLIIDGFAWPDIAFWSQTIPVTPNTNYRFRAWFASIGTGTPADAQIYINGVAAGPHLPIPENGDWAPYTYTWNSGSSTSAIIRAVDLNTSALDNDFAMDDVYFGQIAPFKDSLKVTVYQPAAPSAKDIDTCKQGLTYPLTAIGSNLKWYDDTISGSLGNRTAPIIDFNIPDTLSKWVTQTINGCESKKAELKISVKNLPSVPTTRDTLLCQQSGILTLSAIGTELKWYDAFSGGTNILTPTFNTDTPDTTSRWATQTVNGCESVRQEIKAQINPTPTAPITKDTVLCQQAGNITLSANGNQLTWYDAAVAGNVIAPTFQQL